MNILQLPKTATISKRLQIDLPTSKSMSNRALILHRLGNGKITITNLSEARDTTLLLNLLNSTDEILDAQDAGTTFRFLTAYCCAINRKSIITGTDRMKQRPIKPLVDALLAIGFNIQYLEKEGFPPLQILPIENFQSLRHKVEIKADVSSQFISALLMIAPTLPKGLTIALQGEIVSKTYWEQTIKMLQQCAIEVHIHNNEISILSKELATTHFKIEADWTSAYYWLSLLALNPKGSMILKDLKLNSVQGDSKAIKFLNIFGIHVEEFPNGLLFTKQESDFPKDVSLNFNFSSYPDLAQTFMVLCVAKNIEANFSGLSTLSIKESNRIAAMQNELKKCGFECLKQDDDSYQLKGNLKLPETPIQTYNDHRMAMSFAPLSALGNIAIENPAVVAKSYPHFWQQWQSLLRG